MVWLSGPPGVGTDVDARVFRRRGGSAANVAALCASNGTASRFVGQVGDDALGERLTAALSAAGVDVRVERGATGSRTGTVVVLVAPDGERTMLTDRGSALDLAVVDDRWLDDVDVLHLPVVLAHRRPPRADRDRARASSQSATGTAERRRVVDRRRSRSSAAARYLDLLADLEPDVLLMNGAEAELLDISDRAPKGVALAVIHRGRDSAIAIDGGGPIAEVAPVSVRTATDTTGAGDAFAAGFLPALRGGAPVDSAMAAGHACAARTLDGAGRDDGGEEMTSILLSPEVASAIAERRAVVALESTIFSTLGLAEPGERAGPRALPRRGSRVRRRPGGHRGGRRRRARRARAIRARARARRLSQGRRPRLARRGRAGLVVRRDDGLGVAGARCEGGRRRVRHRGHRRGAPRRRGHGRRQRRPRRARRAPHRDGVRGRQGLPRPRPHARAPRDARRARPRLRHGRAAGVLDAVERAAARAPRRHRLTRPRPSRPRRGSSATTVASS